MFLLYSKMKREMKNFLLKWKKPLLWLTGFVLLVLCWQVWDGLFDAGLALAAIVPGMSGGKIVSNEPLTTDIVREGSPSLLRSEVDKRIVKIRPMSTPIDQLSRWNGSRKASSMIVGALYRRKRRGYGGIDRLSHQWFQNRFGDQLRAVYSREYAAYPYGARGNGTRCADGTIRRFAYQESEFLPDIQNADRAIDFPKNSE